jgi:chemotaxis protein MotB
MDRSSIKRVIGCALATAVAFAAVGCTNVKRADYDAVFDENNELRGQLAAIEGERAMWIDTKGKLEQENADLASALEEMRDSGAVDSGGGLHVPGTKISMRGSDVVVEVAGDVLFDSGKTTVKSSAKETLNRVAQVLSDEFSGYAIRIEGYTDTDPIKKSKWGTNEHLSFERAFAVEKYLASHGVNTKRMYSAAFGPDKPRGSKSESRRVEIVVLGN